MFYKNKDLKVVCIIGIYVDDMLIAGTDKEIKSFINKIKNKYKISKYGPAKYILGINIEKHNSSYYIHQENFIDNLLINFKINNLRKTNTPCTGNNNISENKEPFDSTVYKSALGSLIYLAKCTRPDISFSVHKAAKNVKTQLYLIGKKLLIF